jgi:hypothetical protein
MEGGTRREKPGWAVVVRPRGVCECGKCRAMK